MNKVQFAKIPDTVKQFGHMKIVKLIQDYAAENNLDITDDMKGKNVAIVAQDGTFYVDIHDQNIDISFRDDDFSTPVYLNPIIIKTDYYIYDKDVKADDRI